MFEKKENGVKITFSHADKLNILGEYLEDTFVYNEAGVAFTVEAEIDGNSLILTWEDGVIATKVSMGFGNNPSHNLYNGEGYLASPFSIENEKVAEGVTTIEEVDNYVG